MRRMFGRLAWLGLAVAAGCGGESDPCVDISCSGHGICFTVLDVPACECARGYHPEGLACLSVDPGNPCLGVTCSGRGSCVESDGAASCNCEAGYTPSGLNCLPLSCEPVWSQLFPGTSLIGIAVDSVSGAIFALGSAGSAAVVLQLDACGEQVRQAVLPTPDATYSLATRIVIEGDVLHAIASYEPWDMTSPTESGLLHARLSRTTLDVIDTRELGIGDTWVSVGLRDMVVASDGTWWLAGWAARQSAGGDWENHSLVVREDPAGAFCWIEPQPGIGPTAEAAAFSGGRVWIAGRGLLQGYLKAWNLAGSPAEPACVGGLPVVEQTLLPPGIDVLMPGGMLPDGADGFMLVGEGVIARQSKAVRARWSPSEGWTVPEPWDPGTPYAWFTRAVRGPGGELCAVGGATIDAEDPSATDGTLACYESATLAERFAQCWSSRGECFDVALDRSGGLVVVCSDWVDSVVRRCLPTGECPDS